MCGIPFIRLMGTVQDWIQLEQWSLQIMNHPAFQGVHERFRTDVPVLFTGIRLDVETLIRGELLNEERILHWNNIYKKHTESGGDRITGWVLSLFPRTSHVESVRVGEFPSGIHRIPFEWSYYGNVVPMNMYTGFGKPHVDIQQQTVTPSIGMMIAEKTNQNHIATLLSVNRNSYVESLENFIFRFKQWSVQQAIHQSYSPKLLMWTNILLALRDIIFKKWRHDDFDLFGDLDFEYLGHPRKYSKTQKHIQDDLYKVMIMLSQQDTTHLQRDEKDIIDAFDWFWIPDEPISIRPKKSHAHIHHMGSTSHFDEHGWDDWAKSDSIERHNRYDKSKKLTWTTDGLFNDIRLCNLRLCTRFFTVLNQWVLDHCEKDPTLCMEPSVLKKLSGSIGEKFKDLSTDNKPFSPPHQILKEEL